MGQTGVQFLATQEEIVDMLDWFRSDREMVIAAGHYSEPGAMNLLLPNEPIEWIRNSTFFYLKLGNRFSEENSLFVHANIDPDGSIRESSAGLKGEGPEFDYWKKRLARLKRSFRKGAWLFSPHSDVGTYLKSQYYTDGAQAACQRGVKLMALAGWNYYRLEEPGKEGSAP